MLNLYVCVCAYSYIFDVSTYMCSFIVHSLCVRVYMDFFPPPFISCISYVYVILYERRRVISCMLKSDVSKPVHFRFLLIGVVLFFFLFLQWLSGISSFSTVSSGCQRHWKQGCCTQTSKEGTSCILNRPKCLFTCKQSLIVNIPPAWCSKQVHKSVK